MKIIMFLTLLSVFGCADKEELLADNVLLYKNTPVWEIAQSIEKKDTAKVKDFFHQHPSLIDYQELKFKQSLLNWAVYSNHYEGAVALANSGANPNLERKDGVTPFINAADNHFTSAFLKTLLHKGGQVNYVVRQKEQGRIGTPLIAAAWCRLESVKLLVEAGADVNYKWSMGEQWNNTALYSAFNADKIDIIRYLILEAGANYKDPLTYNLNGDAVYVADKLREMPFALESEEYKLKMEVVAFLKENGIDYRKAAIPQRYYKQYDQAYLEKY